MVQLSSSWKRQSGVSRSSSRGDRRNRKSEISRPHGKRSFRLGVAFFCFHFSYCSSFVVFFIIYFSFVCFFPYLCGFLSYSFPPTTPLSTSGRNKGREEFGATGVGCRGAFSCAGGVRRARRVFISTAFFCLKRGGGLIQAPLSAERGTSRLNTVDFVEYEINDT